MTSSQQFGTQISAYRCCISQTKLH